MQLGFSFDQSKCVGCYMCTFTCMVERNVPFDIYWRKIIWINSKTPLAFFARSCLHCAEPPCLDACPQGAIFKRDKDGLVLIDQDECLGKDDCGLCKEACPYDVPQFGPENDSKMNKCDFCVDRLDKGEKPYCVMGCSHGALKYGPLDELKSEFDGEKPAKGFSYSEEAKPSLVSKEGAAAYFWLS